MEKSEQDKGIFKQGWLLKRGEHIKTWRPRYFILRYDGNFLGYNSPPVNESENANPNNLFFVKDSKISESDRPKNNVFILRCASSNNQKSTVERFFASQNRIEREDWISAFQQVSLRLDGQSQLMKSKRENEKITLHNFEFLKILGKGTFGKVILCREHSTKRLCAMKILKKSLIVEKNEIVHTETENKVMRSLKHPFITSLIYSFQTVDRLCLVMEYVNGGELFFHLSREKKFSECKARFYCAEICYAIGFLHQNQIIYRDIKLENILLDSQGHIKLADFGLCKMNMDHQAITRTFCGTLEYLAPEIVTKSPTGSLGYTRAVDWWAVGVVLYEMLVGRLPFSSKLPETQSQDCPSLFKKIINDHVSLPIDLTNEAKQILMKFLEKDPTRRLGSSHLDFIEIKENPFFAQIDWESLKEKRLEPPFKPQVSSDTDTCYFETEFTGESVQLTPTNTIDNPVRLLPANNLISSNIPAVYFDSFSFYGSISSLGSYVSHTDDKFDLKALQIDSKSMYNNEVQPRSLLKRTRLISHNSLNEEFSCRRKNEDNLFLASSAFPNMIQFTDDCGFVHQSKAFFTTDDKLVRMSTESFESDMGSGSSSNGSSERINPLRQGCLIGTEMIIDERMEV